MLTQITPLILTRNEAANVPNTLPRLAWAREVVVVDSLSDDGTPELLSAFPNVRVVRRPFDSHAAQWNFGLLETGISTPWVLALDADYQLTPEGLAELAALTPADDVAGYRARFRYCVNGRPLRCGAYPPVVVLYRRQAAHYVQDGHTQRVEVAGRIADLHTPLLHDDRKPLRAWIASQQRYARLEMTKLRETPASRLAFADRVRRLRVVAPLAMLAYCLFVRGAVLDGRAGLLYACERAFAELLLSLNLLRNDIFGE
jgi:glycosyltransferase involved in cell wall biosynthesis